MRAPPSWSLSTIVLLPDPIVDLFDCPRIICRALSIMKQSAWAIGIFANSACVESLTLRKSDRPLFPEADVQIGRNWVKLGSVFAQNEIFRLLLRRRQTLEVVEPENFRSTEILDDNGPHVVLHTCSGVTRMKDRMGDWYLRKLGLRRVTYIEEI